jgi:hypothetical protein
MILESTHLLYNSLIVQLFAEADPREHPTHILTNVILLSHNVQLFAEPDPREHPYSVI